MHRTGPGFHFELLLSGDDLLLVVASAALAYSVRHHQRAALRALYQSGSTHFPVCSSLISSSLGRFVLRTDGHILHLLVKTAYAVLILLLYTMELSAISDSLQISHR